MASTKRWQPKEDDEAFWRASPAPITGLVSYLNAFFVLTRTPRRLQHSPALTPAHSCSDALRNGVQGLLTGVGVWSARTTTGFSSGGVFTERKGPKLQTPIASFQTQKVKRIAKGHLGYNNAGNAIRDWLSSRLSTSLLLSRHKTRD